MVHKIHVQPLGWLARIADILMIPIMYLVAGTFSESPQQTHIWNNTKLSIRGCELDEDKIVTCRGDESAVGRNKKLDLHFHLPLIGGWKQYVVLSPQTDEYWHIGWTSSIDAGVSRIKLHGPVRMLIGPGEVNFFGVSANTIQQITVNEIGRGRVGDSGPHSKTPLL